MRGSSRPLIFSTHVVPHSPVLAVCLYRPLGLWQVRIRDLLGMQVEARWEGERPLALRQHLIEQ